MRMRIVCAAMNALEHIRRNVFGATQAEFAAMAGVTQATVSRWENGGVPTLTEMQAIRQQALAREEIDWSDSLFFFEASEPVTLDGKPLRFDVEAAE